MTSIPPEHPEHPDADCPGCGEQLRWCPRCGGYHHAHPDIFAQNHKHWCIVDMEDGTPIFQTEKRMQWEGSYYG